MRLACSPASKPAAFPNGERGRLAGNPSRGEGAAGAGRSGQTELRKQAAFEQVRHRRTAGGGAGSQVAGSSGPQRSCLPGACCNWGYMATNCHCKVRRSLSRLGHSPVSDQTPIEIEGFSGTPAASAVVDHGWTGCPPGRDPFPPSGARAANSSRSAGRFDPAATARRKTKS